jgi:hypothetical protein
LHRFFKTGCVSLHKRCSRCNFLSGNCGSHKFKTRKALRLFIGNRDNKGGFLFPPMAKFFILGEMLQTLVSSSYPLHSQKTKYKYYYQCSLCTYWVVVATTSSTSCYSTIG